MANKGSDTNGSQFFITFRSCKHLDRKHTIFGRVVGGLETLTTIERLETDKKTDKPLEKIKIITTQIFVDPFEEADELLAKERAELKNSELSEKRKTEEKMKKIAKSSDAEISKPKVYREGIGKYIKTGGNNNLESKTLKRQAVETSERKTEESVTLNASKKKSKLVTKVGGALSDFSAW